MKSVEQPINKYRPLIILLVIFLVIRTMILFSSISNLVFNQELCVGTLTKIITQGLRLPVFACLDRYRWGGAIIGIIDVPFFLLFGDNLVVLRSVIMLLSLGTLVVLYLFAYEFFSRRTAIVASLLFIFSPPNYTRISYLSTGSYSELNFISLLTILVFYKIFFTQRADNKISENYHTNYLYALFGFLCGFGLLFDYPFLLTIVCCLLFWLIFDIRFFLKKHFYIFLIFFLVGFGPWFYYNIAYKWNGVFVMHGRSIWQLFTSNSIVKTMAQLKNLLLFDIPGYFDFKDFFFIKGTYLAYTYYFIFTSAFLYLFWLHRKVFLKLLFALVPVSRFRISSKDVPVDTFLIAYSVFFFLVYSLCGFPIFPGHPLRDNIIAPFKEVFPLTLIIFVIIARALDVLKGNRTKWGIFISSACLSGIIVIGLVGNLNLVDFSGFSASLLPKGYNYIRVGKQLKSSCTFKDDLGKCLGLIEKIDKQNRRFVYDGYEWAIYAGLPDVQSYEEMFLKRIDNRYWPFAYERLGEALEKIIRSRVIIEQELYGNLQKEYLPYVYRGMGRAFVKEISPVDLKKYLFLRGMIDEKFRPYFYEGLGIELDEALISNTKKTVKFLNSVDKIDREYIFKGFGTGREYTEISYVKLFLFGFGRLGVDLERWDAIMGSIDDEFRTEASQRLGIELGWRFIYGMKKYRIFLEKTEERYWPSLYKGVGIGIGWRFGYTLDGCKQIVQHFNKRFWPYLYNGLGLGVTRWNGYQLDGERQDMSKVPDDYKSYFEQGVKEAFSERDEVKR